MIPKLTPVVVAMAVGAGCAAGAVGYVAYLKANARSLQVELRETRSELEAQRTQVRVASRTAQVIERRAVATLETQQAASTAIDEVNDAPDLDAALAAFLTGIDRLRASSFAGSGADAVGLGPGAGSSAAAADVSVPRVTEAER